jgi:hypothetical protein
MHCKSSPNWFTQLGVAIANRFRVHPPAFLALFMFDPKYISVKIGNDLLSDKRYL